ncbi:hypothetical protein B0O95_102171 [Mycetohabitans endofungorum]|uniref:Uncharacterized protein n=1 Tax=Mycetohabitans endofungorum TaxID=417203 RepID=A0A2P5KDI0_9BURK|nr:hypothetical protein B0O95_102171 [Mycetohabitans endofungorum]
MKNAQRQLVWPRVLSPAICYLASGEANGLRVPEKFGQCVSCDSRIDGLGHYRS